MTRWHWLIAAMFVLTAGMARAQDAECAIAPEPVFSLSFGSRYADDSATRSEIDPKADADADDALRPIDDFLRDLTASANKLLEDDTDKPALADCIVSQIVIWARKAAMTDLQSDTANLTIGSRLAGFALVMLQVKPHATSTDEQAEILAWLSALMQTQMLFWEEEAPDGARQGNLLAWAALGASALAGLTDDPALRGWATWSVSYVLCKAEADGSLPQEMTRGKYALKYQLHAIAPLVVSVLLLDRQGIALHAICDTALDRIIGFALADLDKGAKTEAITGKAQSFFDGTDEIEAFHLAWIEAYLIVATADAPDRDALNAIADRYRPMNYSKLGGNQSRLWTVLP